MRKSQPTYRKNEDIDKAYDMSVSVNKPSYNPYQVRVETITKNELDAYKNSPSTIVNRPIS